MSEKDKNILNKILLFVVSEDGLEDKLAAFIEKECDDVTKEDFHDWILKIDLFRQDSK